MIQAEYEMNMRNEIQHKFFLVQNSLQHAASCFRLRCKRCATLTEVFLVNYLR